LLIWYRVINTALMIYSAAISIIARGVVATD